jgi:hypothetical protein
MVYMEEIIYTGDLLKLKYETNVVDNIVERIRLDFRNVSAIKNNIEMINIICNIIEDVSYKQKVSDKSELFMKIYAALFPDTNEVDKVFVHNIVNFLHNNGLIKMRSRSLIRYLIDKCFSRKN